MGYLADADYDGNKLIEVIANVALDADDEDNALVQTEYIQCIAKPFTKQLTLETFNGEYKILKEVLSCQATEKPEIEIIATLKLWMRSCPDIRQKYYNVCKHHDCKGDLAAHLKQMRQLLRSVKTTAATDALQSGRNVSLPAVVVPQGPPPTAAEDASKHASLVAAVKTAMTESKKKTRDKAVLDALIAHGVDPVKNLKNAGKNSDKNVVIPRNADGSVKEWVDGMALCKCKGKGAPSGRNDGGKHLYKVALHDEGHPTTGQTGVQRRAAQAGYDRGRLAVQVRRFLRSHLQPFRSRRIRVLGRRDERRRLHCVRRRRLPLAGHRCHRARLRRGQVLRVRHPRRGRRRPLRRSRARWPPRLLVHAPHAARAYRNFGLGRRRWR